MIVPIAHMQNLSANQIRQLKVDLLDDGIAHADAFLALHSASVSFGAAHGVSSFPRSLKCQSKHGSLSSIPFLRSRQLNAPIPWCNRPA